MDRFVVKEPRVGAGFPQGNQTMAFPANARSGNMMPPENLYCSSGYPHNFQNVQQTVMNVPPNMSSSHLVHAQPHMNSPQMGSTQTFSHSTTMVPQGHMSSGIDPRYLAGYGDTSSHYILAGQQQQRNQPINSFGTDYQNRGFGGADRNNVNNVPHSPQVMMLGGIEPARVEEIPKPRPYTIPEAKTVQNQPTFHNKFASSNKPNELDLIRNDVQQMMSRADKLKTLNKSGPRAFSGPVEKVLKWHKTLQGVGILIIYEIVGKCVSVRPGEKCAKNLVVRDDNGPAMQVVYYEIDFLLPELKLPCTVRVVGRMMAGTCRLQAFNVRPATGDDVSTLPRRAAVATHHVAKLCKEFGHNGHA